MEAEEQPSLIVGSQGEKNKPSQSSPAIFTHRNNFPQKPVKRGKLDLSQRKKKKKKKKVKDNRERKRGEKGKRGKVSGLFNINR